MILGWIILDEAFAHVGRVTRPLQNADDEYRLSLYEKIELSLPVLAYHRVQISTTVNVIC